VLAVEMFVVGHSGATLWFNEIAPRVHNSATGRSMGLGLPVRTAHSRHWPAGRSAKPVRHGPGRMTNLIGDDKP